MNKKTATLAIGAALLIAAAIVFTTRNSAKPEEKQAASGAGKPGSAANGIGSASAATGADHVSKPKPRDVAQNSELVAKYGESRTNLSKFIATNVISLFEDGVEMGEMATSGKYDNAFGGLRGALGRSLGGLDGRLNLTDEQREKAGPVLIEYQKREIARSKETIEKLKKDPTSLMKLMLVSDSFSRGEITEEQYKEARTASGDELKGVFNPLDRNSMRGHPLKDDEFREEFEAILDPAQAETYQREMSEQQSREALEGDRTSISNMPSMELEKLDQTIAAAKKFTTGMKSMMEGMGGLQDLGPMIEQQRRMQGGTPAPKPAE